MLVREGYNTYYICKTCKHNVAKFNGIWYHIESNYRGDDDLMGYTFDLHCYSKSHNTCKECNNVSAVSCDCYKPIPQRKIHHYISYDYTVECPVCSNRNVSNECICYKLGKYKRKYR